MLSDHDQALLTYISRVSFLTLVRDASDDLELREWDIWYTYIQVCLYTV